MTHLTDEDIERIAEAVAEKAAEKAADKAVAKALQQMYVQIGKGVLTKAMWIVGMGVVALMIWLNSHGFK